jgi:hypothetical protein
MRSQDSADRVKPRLLADAVGARLNQSAVASVVRRDPNDHRSRGDASRTANDVHAFAIVQIEIYQHKFEVIRVELPLCLGDRRCSSDVVFLQKLFHYRLSENSVIFYEQQGEWTRWLALAVGSAHDDGCVVLKFARWELCQLGQMLSNVVQVVKSCALRHHVSIHVVEQSIGSNDERSAERHRFEVTWFGRSRTEQRLAGLGRCEVMRRVVIDQPRR